MKIPIKSILGSATVLAVALIGIAAISPAVKPIAPYEREQTKGNVRVVLLKVERATIFTTYTNGIRDPQPGKCYPMPTVAVTYLIQALGDAPIKGWQTGYWKDDSIMIGNHKLKDNASMPENLRGDTYNDLVTDRYSSVNMSKIVNDKRYTIREQRVDAIPLKSGTMQVMLNEVGFNDEKETFVFENIPLN